ncbi:MAG TPA: mevalonate kinase [Candidatus Binatia bacterium]|nr:mevalonate kinase [Candidatus Binatia bacterium]
MAVPAEPRRADAPLVPARASAGGKLILLGEHAVVHGHPAIAAGIPARVEVSVTPCAAGEDTLRAAAGFADPRLAAAVAEARSEVGIPEAIGLEIGIAGDLPVAIGLGSSAALSVALVRALAACCGRALADEQVAAAAHRLESLFHGKPSGVDATAATYGGLFWFEAGPPPRRLPLRAARPLEVVVVLTGSRHDTGRVVGGLRERAAAAPAVYRPVLAAIGELVRGARDAIERGDVALLGELMTMDHALLRACGVSTPVLDAAVHDALAAGALGAKLTGGGGGGAAIALARGDARDLARSLGERGYEAMAARIPAD